MKRTSPHYTPRQVVSGWIVHTIALHREAEGLGPDIPESEVIRYPVLAQTRYGAREPEPQDETTVAKWLCVETFFRKHPHRSPDQGALIAGKDCPGFWAEFEPWYLASPLMKPFKAGSTEAAVKLVDAAAIWNAQCPDDPLTYDALRKAKSTGALEVTSNAEGWDMVSLGAIAIWRANVKQNRANAGGKREGAGRPRKVAA